LVDCQAEMKPSIKDSSNFLFAAFIVFLLSCGKAPAVVEQISVERASPVVSFKDSVEKSPAKIDIQGGSKKSGLPFS